MSTGNNQNNINNTTWKCLGCQDTLEGGAEIQCSTCELCKFCCDMWGCTICHKSYCGESNNRCEACANCQSCCTCWTCTRCQRRHGGNRPACATCGLCRNNGCCRCYECGRCAIRYREGTANSCRDCGYCNNCCQCPGVDRYHPRNTTFHKATSAKQFKLNPSHRFIAAEIEIADISNDKSTAILDTIKKWGASIVDDGSLPHTGFEINTAPANGDLYCQQITEICNALEIQGAKINGQCGLHIHVDARDYTYYDLRRLVLAYDHVEPALFEIVGPERAQSRYCKPCAKGFVKNIIETKNPEDSKKRIISNVYSLSLTRDTDASAFMRAVRGQKYNNARYAAMNIHSWFMRGTIENRMHQGTKNVKHIINWGMLWAGVIDYAMRTPEKILKEMSGSSMDKLMVMAPTNGVRDWIVSRMVYFKKVKEKRAAKQSVIIAGIPHAAYTNTINTTTLTLDLAPGATPRRRIVADAPNEAPANVDANIMTDYDEETFDSL